MPTSVLRNQRVQLLLSAALLFTSGCAFTSEVIRIEPVAPPGVVATGGAQPVVLRLSVADLREDQTQVVGRKINGYGMRLATVSNDTPLADVLSRAVTVELQANGFRVANEGDVTLVVELIVFSHEFRTGFWTGKSEANVTFLATLRDRTGKELFRQVVFGPHEHDIALADGDNVKKAYEGALSVAAQKLVSNEAFQKAVLAGLAPPVL